MIVCPFWMLINALSRAELIKINSLMTPTVVLIALLFKEFWYPLASLDSCRMADSMQMENPNVSLESSFQIAPSCFSKRYGWCGKFASNVIFGQDKCLWVPAVMTV